VPTDCTYIPYRATHSFSALVYDYTEAATSLTPFYTFQPDAAGLAAAIAEREQYPTDRNALVQVLRRQYEKLPEQEAANRNIELLLQDNTFTVCTAHQPNLLTGYLYFIYKIVHAIKLAETLKAEHPDKHFVPVYYMGSEDNDLDELGTFRYGGTRYVWDADGQTGAVGRMHTQSLKPLLDQLFLRLGPPGPQLNELKRLIKEAYLQHDTIADATQFLVHELFGRFGLIVLNPDEPELKRLFIPVLRDDLLQHTALPIVQQQSDLLEKQYKAQAYPRPVNLFYLKDNIRERIERNGDTWSVLNHDIHWNETALLAELEAHPERFSPNVILRGLFQETILPDVAFIGGGSEVAYWMQLKPLFEHYQVYFPAVVLRQSIQWIDANAAARMQQLELGIRDVFESQETLLRNHIARHSDADWTATGEKESFARLIAELGAKAAAIDPTLAYSAGAVLKKVNYQLEVLEQKMYRAEKKKAAVAAERITLLRGLLFPGGGLQERTDNFMDHFLKYGHDYFDLLLAAVAPLKNEFLVISEPAI
jgi:bacillithiol biosynthesis cysteine-adding enzyme BshC